MNRIIIIGAGGLGREVLSWIRQAKTPLEVKGFLDDNPRALESFQKNVPILGTVSGYQPEPEDRFVCAIGRVDLKQHCVTQIKSRGGVFTNVVHETAVVGDGALLGEGVILCPHSVVSADARLGDYVTVNLHSTVAHDAVVSTWSQLHCHVDVTGGVFLGESVTMGSHSSVLPRLHIGNNAMVGAGSIVMSDVPAWTTVFGSPARPYNVHEVVNG